MMSSDPVDTAPTVPSPAAAEEPSTTDPGPYYFEGGLRRVRPYHYTYNTYCKERWRDRTLLDIFTSEFRDRETGYYQKALESGKVCVNGKSAGPDTILKNGQYISHTLHRHEPPVTGNDIGIIHESDDLLAIDKPAGVPVHSTGRYHYNSVIEILRYKYEDKFTPRPCNRLDRLTSGVMFVGKTAKGADTMAVKLRARTVQKEYVARVKGKFPDGITVVDQPIMSVAPKVGLNRVRATGKEAKTKFRRLAYYPPPSVPTHSPSMEESTDPNARPATPPPSYINESEGYSVVHCLPLTGRTHQIRVHLQFLGHPISNDPIYSNRRVFGPDLGKDDSTADHDDAIVDRLMKMGRTELPETVSYRTHFTTPPVLPKGTDSSVVETILSREHEAAVEAYQKRKGERLSGKKCDECGTELYTDPGVHELGIFLHAVSYSDSDGEWSYRSKMPSWALPPASAGVGGPTEVPEWVDVPEDEEIVYGSGEVPDIGNEDAPASAGVTALVEGVGLVDISEARRVEEQQRATAAAASNGV
ncbi:pseudouridine synthase [Aspergillus carlsbadensis]|nr:pseudouridine synthase [Aspergillus carlsbadensis]